jgi:hypothetical protein
MYLLKAGESGKATLEFIVENPRDSVAKALTSIDATIVAG